MAPGETVLNNRYKLVSQLASGGMAVVYKAEDRSLGRAVAVKILRPSLTTDPVFITRFQNEARSIANLAHPNIVTLHDVGNDGPTYYIVMELVKGSDLKKMVRTHGALPLDRAVNLAIQICEGIGYAHRAGIVHADVKPQNVLLTEKDVVKITDFGIAQALSDTQPAERASVVWGSPHYFAPEQAQGEKPTAAADVYSIGIVIFEMLTGRLPYTGSNQQELAMAHIKTPVPDVREFNPNIPEELANIVRKVMKKHPNDRYNQAGQLATVLKQYRDNAGQRTMGGMPAPRPPQVSPEERSQPREVDRMPPPPPHPGSMGGRPGTNPDSPPTQRYNPVPEAPPSYEYGRAAQSPGQQTPPPPGPGQPQGAAQHPRAFTMPPRAYGEDSRPLSDSQRYPYNQQLPPAEDEGFQLDGVTLVLGILAFLSVAGLIPLYIVAILARL
ncbi:MAG: protein kinase domain-containing protein [Chloroflexota bacterium]